MKPKYLEKRIKLTNKVISPLKDKNNNDKIDKGI